MFMAIQSLIYFYIKDQFHLILYGDLCLGLFDRTESFLRFLEAAHHKLIETFIEQHIQTSSNTGTSYIKIRSSSIDIIIPSFQ